MKEFEKGIGDDHIWKIFSIKLIETYVYSGRLIIEVLNLEFTV